MQHESNSGKSAKFNHLKHYYPGDGQLCKPEGATQPGEIEMSPEPFKSMSGPDGYHETPQAGMRGPARPSDPGMALGGPELASTPDNPTRGEGSQGIHDYPHQGAPERTTSVGKTGVQHNPGMRPRGDY